MERKVGLKLPDAYKQFMSVIGKSAGNFMTDLQVFYPKVLQCTEEMSEILMSNFGVSLPDNAFVFADRFGEQMLFFHITEGNDDPPIFAWSDEDPEVFEKVCNSLSEFFEAELAAHEM